MKVFVAGATGAIGRQLVPRLVAVGHQVVAMTSKEANRQLVTALGAEVAVADALDADQVVEAVARASPEVIVHQLTAIGSVDLRHLDRDFAVTNRLRTEGTDHLLSAGRAVGSGGSWRRARCTATTHASAARSRTRRPRSTPLPRVRVRETAAAIKRLETAVLGAGWTQGIVLRYGAFYGPNTSLSPGGEQFEMVRQRKFPLVGNGAGMWSFIHIADAADATVAAVDHGYRGIYNVVDDDPAPVAEWLPTLAEILGAKRPMHVPRFVGRVFAGGLGVAFMTEIRGASNEKAKRDLRWQPEHPSWREGFREVSAAGTARLAEDVLEDSSGERQIPPVSPSDDQISSTCTPSGNSTRNSSRSM